MNTIHVLIVVDALGATSSNNLQDNVYLVDTNKHNGSGREGKAALFTACKSTSQTGDTIIWAIMPVDPDSDVSIDHFTGDMISSEALVPEKYPDNAWYGTLSKGLPTGHINYSVVVNIDGDLMPFIAFLKVVSE